MIQASVIRELASLLGKDRVSTEPVVLGRYAWDALGRYRAFPRVEQLRSMPDVVVTPLSAQEVSRVLALASRHGVPVVPYGGGTGGNGRRHLSQRGDSHNGRRFRSLIQQTMEREFALVRLSAH